jgi:hypothetical protein
MASFSYTIQNADSAAETLCPAFGSEFDVLVSKEPLLAGESLIGELAPDHSRRHLDRFRFASRKAMS